MIEKTTKIISGIFAVMWCVVIFSEFWRYNPEYGRSIQYFQYADLLVFFIGIGAALSWGIPKIKSKSIKFVNGLTVFAGLLIIDLITMLFFYGKIDSIQLTGRGLFLHWGHLIGVAAAVFLIYLTARTGGKMLTTIFPIKIAKADLPIIQTCIGIMVLTFLLFFFGTFGLLKNWVIASFLLIVLLANYRDTIQIVKSALFQPLKITKGLNALGVFSFLFLGVFLIYDFVHVLRPFPVGTDSINIYVNLPKLIGESGSLVAGNQPYNWSLFMSLGTVVFGRIDVTLALSFLGGFLALRALYQLSRKWLSINQSALCLLLFGSMPMTNFFLYQDLKIDLGLLFVTLCVLLILHNLIVPQTTQMNLKTKSPTLKTKKGTKQKNKTLKAITPNWLINAKTFFSNRMPAFLKENHLLVLIGLLSGFAFGIKLTVLFFFLAIGTAFWYFKGGIISFLAAFCLVFGAVFILKLDAQPLLRGFHETVNELQWLLFAVGLGLFGYLFFKAKNTAISLVKSSFVIGVFFLLPVTPWLGKNFLEADKISIYTLTNGKPATPVMRAKQLKKLLEKSEKK